MQSVLIFMVICAAVFWIVKSCNYIAEYENYEVFFFETGILFLFAGMIMDCLQILLGTSIHLRYIQPLCSLGYLGCVYLMFLFDQKNSLTKARQLLCLEKEMAAIQSLLLASRLKPHFLYNTLTTIQELCYTDPRKAARMIVKFSNYLRSNMDFMNHTTLIPFETELNHIRNYIAIQKMRFEDELEYKEDISYVDFEIPQLTIQPLIENAIQHGIRKNPLGGCVELICQKQDNYITIIVRNDGSDFTEEAKTSSHSLNTIEKCLSNLLNAVMEISYNPENNKASVTIKINMLTAQR